MKTAFNCEVCGHHAWQSIGHFTYKQEEFRQQTPYIQKRSHVLFTVWFPGVDEVTLEFLSCKECGFVCYSPRPETDDIDAKYLKIKELGQDYGSAESEAITHQRSLRIQHLSMPKTTDQKRVLDFGGGDGRLMWAFLNAKCNCFLVDYNTNPIDGVSKIGDVAKDIPPDYRFDLIIASHVLEHVANPCEVIRSLASHLDTEGSLYVEVPLEIWNGPPYPNEPVTHINWFVLGSLQRMLQESGLDVIEKRVNCYMHSSGRLLPGIYAIGKKSKITSINRSGYREAMSYIKPNIATRIKRKWQLRELMVNRFVNRIRRLTLRMLGKR